LRQHTETCNESKLWLLLRSLLNNAVDTALFEGLVYADMDKEEAREHANGWVEQNIKGQP